MILDGVRRLARQGWVAARDWIHLGPTYARAQLARLRRPPEPRWSPTHGCSAIPIVMLPGIFEPWSYLAPLGRALEDHGHPVHYVETLGWNLAGLSTSAEHCLQVLTERGITSAVLVAHSKGGLIGKAMLLADDLVGMVALATPFAGSTIGGPFQRLVARSPLGLFDPRAAELAALARDQRVNARIVSLAPAWDQLIPNGSRLDGATNITLEVAGHFRPVHDPAVWKIIHRSVHDLARGSGESG